MSSKFKPIYQYLWDHKEEFIEQSGIGQTAHFQLIILNTLFSQQVFDIHHYLKITICKYYCKSSEMQLQPFLDEPLNLPDDYKPIKDKLELINQRLKKAITMLSVITVVLFILALYLGIAAAADPATDNLRIENKELATANQQLEGNNFKMERDIQSLGKNIDDLNTNISRLNQEVNTTNQEVADLQENIKQNCDIYHQKLRLNDTNIKNIKISLPASVNYNPLVPAIIDLNLSTNTLTKFCENSLPDLLTIDLSNNPITNMSNNKLDSLASLTINSSLTLSHFDGNHLPVLTKLDITKNQLSSFKNNYFPLIQILQLSNNQISEISNFTLLSLSNLSIPQNPLRILKNNTFPALADLHGIDQSNLNEVSSNYFGKIERFVLSCKKNFLIFQLNNIPRLTNLTINSCQYDYSKIKTNDFPLLTYLQISDGRLNNFQYYPQLKSLQKLSLSSTDITSFSNHTYQITSLQLIGNSNLNSFENNNFSRLEQLRFVNSSKLADICHNYMPNLKNMELTLFNLRNITCFNNYQSLEVIDTLYGSFESANYLDLPKLKKLLLKQARFISFLANRLPSLEHLQIQVVTARIDFTSFQNTLQILELIGSFTSFSNNQLPMLKQLTLTSNDLHQMQFVNNNFPSLTIIALNNVSMSDLDKNIFGTLQSMKIYSCLSECILSSTYYNNLQYLEIGESIFQDFSNKKMPLLQNLTIVNSHLESFLANQLPKVKEVYLSRNNLQSFDCQGIKYVEKLDLSFNSLTDDIAITLCSCKLSYLAYINLRQNQAIKDPLEAKRILSECYNAQINI